MKELTELIPSDAYLTGLNLRGGPADARRAGALGLGPHHGARKSKRFKNVNFASPTTKQGDKERFSHRGRGGAVNALRARLQALWARLQGWYAGHSQRDQRIILGVLSVRERSAWSTCAASCPLRELPPARRRRDRRGAGAARALGALRRLGRLAARRARRAWRSGSTQARTRLLPGRGGTLGAAALQERANSLAAEKGITVQSTQVMKEEAVDPYRKVRSG